MVLLAVQPAISLAAEDGDASEDLPTILPGEGIDGVDDIIMPAVSTGDTTVDSILNFVLSFFGAIVEVLYDAFVKGPMLALWGAWGVVYTALLSWNIAAPMAWAISTLLFVAVGVVIIWLLATAMDWIM